MTFPCLKFSHWFPFVLEELLNTVFFVKIPPNLCLPIYVIIYNILALNHSYIWPVILIQPASPFCIFLLSIPLPEASLLALYIVSFLLNTRISTQIPLLRNCNRNFIITHPYPLIFTLQAWLPTACTCTSLAEGFSHDICAVWLNREYIFGAKLYSQSQPITENSYFVNIPITLAPTEWDGSRTMFNTIFQSSQENSATPIWW